MSEATNVVMEVASDCLWTTLILICGSGSDSICARSEIDSYFAKWNTTACDLDLKGYQFK